MAVLLAHAEIYALTPRISLNKSVSYRAEKICKIKCNFPKLVRNHRKCQTRGVALLKHVAAFIPITAFAEVDKIEQKQSYRSLLRVRVYMSEHLSMSTKMLCFPFFGGDNLFVAI